jgi:hypothetical protein
LVATYYGGEMSKQNSQFIFTEDGGTAIKRDSIERVDFIKMSKVFPEPDLYKVTIFTSSVRHSSEITLLCTKHEAKARRLFRELVSPRDD